MASTASPRAAPMPPIMMSRRGGPLGRFGITPGTTSSSATSLSPRACRSPSDATALAARAARSRFVIVTLTAMLTVFGWTITSVAWLSVPGRSPISSPTWRSADEDERNAR